MRWDPEQYGRYAAERGRPFIELLDRIEARAPRRVVDLGCGPGTLTRLLADKWPDARIEGIDASAEMIDQAQALDDSRIEFRLGDIQGWSPEPDVDVVISNAALQWVPDHLPLITAWAQAMTAGSWLAWQVPGNFDFPSHKLMRELVRSPRWAQKVGDVLRHHDIVYSPAAYAQLLLVNGWTADAWETTYLHVLHGPDAVLEWVRGTGLRPVLAALDAQDPSGRDSAEYEASYSTALRSAYPETGQGTVFDFRRVFAVGHKP
jgi:trans-aconitate 2-methyltransferase